MSAAPHRDIALLLAVQDLLWCEADCADEHRFDEWLALWHSEGELLYWVPAGGDDIDPQRHLSIIYDNRARLHDRIFRLKSRFVHAAQPRSRMRRVVSNIVIEPTDASDASCLRVRANFVLCEVRKGHQDVFAGRALYDLVHTDAGLRITGKKVLLINNDEFIDNLSFLL